jgi:dihydrofolate reductase
MPKPIRIIVAASRNRIIGRAGKLPWDIPEDRGYLETQTRGHTVIMGRWSFIGWPEATRGRDVVVVTRDHTLAQPNVGTATSLTEALKLAERGRGDVFICGGQRIYEEALPLADLLFLTLIDADVAGDTFFPDWRSHFTREVARRDSRDLHWRYSFLVLGK